MTPRELFQLIQQVIVHIRNFYNFCVFIYNLEPNDRLFLFGLLLVVLYFVFLFWLNSLLY